MTVIYSEYFPLPSTPGVEGRSLIDLTSTSVADLFASATDYNAGTLYSKGTLVYNQNSIWVYVNATASTGNAPPTLPTVSNAYWELVAATNTNTFTWIAYGNSTDGITFTDFTTGSSTTGGITRKWIGIAVNKTTAVESTTTSDYSWSRFVGDDGTSGLDGLAATLTNEATQLFAYADGTVSSYTGASGYFKVFSGNTDISSNFSLSTISNPQTLSVTYTGQQYTITGGFDAGEDTASIIIRGTGTGPYTGVAFDKVFSLGKAKGGYEIVAALPTTNLFSGRVVFNEADDKLYRYTGTAWTASVAAPDLTGTIEYQQIGNGAIRAQHLLIAPKSLNVDPSFASGATGWAGFVQRLPRSNASVPASCPAEFAAQFNSRDNMYATRLSVIPGESYKISGWVNKGSGGGGAGLGFVIIFWDINSNFINAAVPSTTSSGWQFVTGTSVIPSNTAYITFGPWADRTSYTGEAWYTDLSLEKVNDASLIVNGAITADKIDSNAITTDKLNAGAVTAAKVATSNLITLSAQINDGIITTAKIGDAQINTAKIGDLQVSTLKIAGNAVTVGSSAYSDTDITVSTVSTWVVLQSLTITSSGGPITVLCNCNIYGVDQPAIAQVRLVRDSTTVVRVGGLKTGNVSSSSDSAIMVLDTPSAGTHTYSLEGRAISSSFPAKINGNFIFALETKR